MNVFYEVFGIGFLMYADELESEIRTACVGAVYKTFWRMSACNVVIEHMIVKLQITVEFVENMGNTKNGDENLHDRVGIDGLYSGIVILIC